MSDLSSAGIARAALGALVSMRVAIITESFPPDVNGVAHSVLRVAELLAGRGHHPLVIAPRPLEGNQDGGSWPFPVVRVPAVPLPGYPSFRIGLPSGRVRDALIRHRAEVVHLASPVVLGAHGAMVARRLGLPTVAVYQTDLPSYARAYRLGRAGEAFAWRWLRGIHNGAARTLAPSTVTATGLLAQGISNVWLWGRGVDGWMATKGTAWLVRRSRDLVPALLGLAVREWLTGGRDDARYGEDERRAGRDGARLGDTQDSAGRDSAGREPANLNVLSRHSGNLQHHERLPLAGLKVWNRSSRCNGRTKPHGGSELRARS